MLAEVEKKHDVWEEEVKKLLWNVFLQDVTAGEDPKYVGCLDLCPLYLARPLLLLACALYPWPNQWFPTHLLREPRHRLLRPKASDLPFSPQTWYVVWSWHVQTLHRSHFGGDPNLCAASASLRPADKGSRIISPRALDPRTLGPRTLDPRHPKSQGPVILGPMVLRTISPGILGPWKPWPLGPKVLWLKVLGPMVQGT